MVGSSSSLTSFVSYPIYIMSKFCIVLISISTVHSGRVSLCHSHCIDSVR